MSGRDLAGMEGKNYRPDVDDNNIVLTRIRLARNVRGLPFYISDRKTAEDVVKNVARAARRAGEFDLYHLSMMKPIRREALKERHLVSSALIRNAAHSAVLVSEDESLSVMIHEEDVLREQCFMRGLALSEGYKRLDMLDDELSKTIDFAFDEKLGYLTACPTNTGTGMRASVMLFLPALTESGKLKAVVGEIEKEGLTVRGAYGEGSKAEGNLYQVSNEVTLGVSEREIVSKVEKGVLCMCAWENATRESYYKPILLSTENECRRALAVLENSVLLGYGEYLNYISGVKLGISLGFFRFENPQAIDDLTIAVRPAILAEREGRTLGEEERDRCRAEFVKRSLVKIKGNV